MEQRLYDACRCSQFEEAKEILEKYPEINVNWKTLDFGEWSCLHRASADGHSSLVSLLLANPNINVNQKSLNGLTPFLVACWEGRTSVVRLLLKDARVLVNERANDESTALRWAAYFGYSEIVKWMIASGRHLDLGQPRDWSNDPIWAAKGEGLTEIVSLLERFKENPVQVRRNVRLELGDSDQLAAEVFAVIVFISDGLLSITSLGELPSSTKRFFAVAQRLPIELQMMLCHRVVGSMKDLVFSEESEPAFKELATKI